MPTFLLISFTRWTFTNQETSGGLTAGLTAAPSWTHVALYLNHSVVGDLLAQVLLNRLLSHNCLSFPAPAFRQSSTTDRQLCETLCCQRLIQADDCVSKLRRTRSHERNKGCSGNQARGPARPLQRRPGPHPFARSRLFLLQTARDRYGHLPRLLGGMERDGSKPNRPDCGSSL